MGLAKAVLSGLGLLALISPSKAAAAQCPSVPNVEVRVIPLHGEIKRDFSLTVAEMRRLGGRRLAARHYPLLGMTGTPFGYSIDVNADTTLGDDGMVCPAPRSVEVRVGFGERTIFIVKEAKRDACLVEAVVAHQLEHVHSDDGALDEFAPELARKLRAYVGRESVRPALNADGAKSNLNDLVGKYVERTVDDFNRRRGDLHNALDSPEELAHLRNACRGRGKSLVEGERSSGL